MPSESVILNGSFTDPNFELRSSLKIGALLFFAAHSFAPDETKSSPYFYDSNCPEPKRYTSVNWP